MNHLITRISEQLAPLLTAEQQTWLAKAIKLIEQVTTYDDLELELLNQSVFVKRKFTQEVDFSAEFSAVNLAQLVRILLIKNALETGIKIKPDSQTKTTTTLLKNYYQFGDESEKCALLAGLNWLDSQGLAVQTAIKACRCNSLIEYSAIALNNPYPAEYFPELNFNQLVLKSLFMGLDISQITNLKNRLNPKLSNMCFAYAIEQALADRQPPASIWQAVIFNQLDKDNQSQVQQYLKHFMHQDAQHQAQINQQLDEQNVLSLLD